MSSVISQIRVGSYRRTSMGKSQSFRGTALQKFRSFISPDDAHIELQNAVCVLADTQDSDWARWYLREFRPPSSWTSHIVPYCTSCNPEIFERICYLSEGHCSNTFPLQLVGTYLFSTGIRRIKL